MNETMIGIVAGGVITILVTIAVENLRRPKLRLRIAPPNDVTYGPGRPATSNRYLGIDLIGEPLPRIARWMSRSPALQCRGTITFHNEDGQRFFTGEMPVRFARTPEPVPASIVMSNGAVGQLVDYNRLSSDSRIDVYPGEATPLDVAVRFDTDTDCYGWSNLNYFSNPPWRHPDWKLPRGRYLVRVSISSSGAKCDGLFRLLNQGALKDFRLEPAQPGDRAF